MNPYYPFISSVARLFEAGKSLPLGGIPPLRPPQLAPDAPAAIIFSPHPDDEGIIGGLALRLMKTSALAANKSAQLKIPPIFLIRHVETISIRNRNPNKNIWT